MHTCDSSQRMRKLSPYLGSNSLKHVPRFKYDDSILSDAVPLPISACSGSTSFRDGVACASTFSDIMMNYECSFREAAGIRESSFGNSSIARPWFSWFLNTTRT